MSNRKPVKKEAEFFYMNKFSGEQVQFTPKPEEQIVTYKEDINDAEGP